jgi:hypothetical protein
MAHVAVRSRDVRGQGDDEHDDRRWPDHQILAAITGSPTSSHAPTILVSTPLVLRSAHQRGTFTANMISPRLLSARAVLIAALNRVMRGLSPKLARREPAKGRL